MVVKTHRCQIVYIGMVKTVPWEFVSWTIALEETKIDAD